MNYLYALHHILLLLLVSLVWTLLSLVGICPHPVGLFLLCAIDLSLLHRSSHLHVFNFLLRHSSHILSPGELLEHCRLRLCLCLLLLPLSCILLLLSCNRRLQFFLGDVHASHLHQHVEEKLLVSPALYVQLFDKLQVRIREGFVSFLDATAREN